MIEIRKLYQSGESIVAAVPRKWLRTLKWAKGTTVRLELVGKKITIERAIVEGESAYLTHR